MASTLRRTWILLGALTAILCASACSNGGASEASAIPVRATVGDVDGWRRGWEPAAARFWDEVGAWEQAQGTPSDPVPGGAAAAATSAAPGIVAAATAWQQTVPADDLPGDVTSEAAQLTDRLGAVASTWKRIGACGADAGCVTPLVTEARLQIFQLRSAQFALRPE